MLDVQQPADVDRGEAQKKLVKATPGRRTSVDAWEEGQRRLTGRGLIGRGRPREERGRT